MEIFFVRSLFDQIQVRCESISKVMNKKKGLKKFLLTSDDDVTNVAKNTRDVITDRKNKLIRFLPRLNFINWTIP